MNIFEFIFSTGDTFLGIPSLFLGLALVALIVTAVGFYRLVYFVSVGYGLSIAALGVLSLILFRRSIHLPGVLHVGVLTIYGLRLGLFLLYRDFQTSYRSDEEEVKRAESIKSIPLKLTIWLSCGILYAVMFTPVLFHLCGAAGERSLPILTAAGVALSGAGILLESLADFQKNRAKQDNPGLFVSNKLYRLVRQPNYFGEILVWTGSFIAGIPYYFKMSWLIIAALGYLIIFLIMLGSSKRLELKQERRYGHLESFQTYSKKTPLLFPLIPVYSLKNWKITLG